MWVYENNFTNSARFVLGEIGINPLICFGINSSTARPPDSIGSDDPESNLDPTVKRVRRYSKDGFDGWIMLNIYPQRATNPEKIHTMGESLTVKALHKRNLLEIKRVFDYYPVRHQRLLDTLV